MDGRANHYIYIYMPASNLVLVLGNPCRAVPPKPGERINEPGSCDEVMKPSQPPSSESGGCPRD